MIGEKKKNYKYCIYIILLSSSVIILLMLFSLQNNVENSKRYKLWSNETIFHYPFKYDINNDMCTNNSSILGILIITSYSGNTQARISHRITLPSSHLHKLGLRRVFLLAQVPKAEKFTTQASIEEENNRHHDIIQGHFIEAYRNLTYKHIMGLHWVSNYCQTAKFVVKLDDDIVFDIYAVKKLLEHNQINSNELYLSGYVLEGMKPMRNSTNKWFVTPQEYESSSYPTFLSGWLYLTTPYTAQQLVDISLSTPYFWIDDTYITGILAKKLKIKHINIKQYFTVHPEHLECCITDWKNHNYKCDFFVAPSGSDNTLLPRFNYVAFHCSFIKNCLERPKSKSVDKTCVTARKKVLPANGNAIIENIRL